MCVCVSDSSSLARSLVLIGTQLALQWDLMQSMRSEAINSKIFFIYA